MHITFILLAHQHPRVVERLTRTLTGAGHSVVLHFDKNAPDAEFEALNAAFSGSSQVRLAARVRVGWGHWSIVEAVLACVDCIHEAGWNPDYVYHISGSDYPIRPAAALEAFLTRNAGRNYIEGVPADTTLWVKGGPQRERYQYRYYFNWRQRQKLAETSLKLQQFLRLNRRFVGGLRPFIGSQWWLLTWDTLKLVLDYGRRREVIRFFKTTLIPDELYFQTLVYNLTDTKNIVGRAPTLYQFTDYMVPVVYCADKVEYLLRQPFFMARKMSPNRPELFDRLDVVWRGEQPVKPFSDEQVGRVSLEYERTRLAQRDGLRGKLVVSKPPDPWMEHLGRVETPFFAVIGMSSSELRFAHALLSQDPRHVCHGQLFHPAAIEFARQAKRFAGYGAHDLKLRDLSAPNFLADVVRAANRPTGFLLLLGQGWHIPEIMFEHPHAKVMIVRGGPLTGFIEFLQGSVPRLEGETAPVDLRTIPPSIVVKRFEEFRRIRDERFAKIDALLAGAKAKGSQAGWSWLTEVDLDTNKPPLIASHRPQADLVSMPTRQEVILDRWRDWIGQVGLSLGYDVKGADDAELWARLAKDIADREANRELVLASLKAGGHPVHLSVDALGDAGVAA